MVVQYLQKPFFLATIFLCFIFYSGLFNIKVEESYYCLFPREDITEITGTILKSPSKTGSGKYYSTVVELNHIRDTNNYFSTASGRIKVLIPTDMAEAFFPGKLYSRTINKGSFLYEAGGIYTFSGKNRDSGFIIEKCTDNSWPATIFGRIDYFRALCRLQFKRLMYSWGVAGGLLLALLSGAREYTEKNLSDCFRNSGLSHILALSGMHLSMFSSIAVYVGNKIGNKNLTYIFRIIIIIIFVWFAGFSPSLLRAFICSFLAILAIISGSEEPDKLMILCFAFLLQCIISPADIWNLGFILSYGALAGILLLNKPLFKIYSKLFPGYLSASLSSSTSAQIFTIPVSIRNFGFFTPIGIIATTVISPLITFFIYSGLILIILSLIFPILMSSSGIFMNLQYTVIKFLVTLFSQFPKWSIN